jgi:hypothetical protein
MSTEAKAVTSREVEALPREEATLVNIVFRSPTTPWGILEFRREDGSNFTATGNFGKSVLYEDYIMYGRRVPDCEGGDFEVENFTSRPPRSVNALAGYLTSLTGAPRGVTSTLAQHFGESLIEVIERNPDSLYEVDVPEKDIERLLSGWQSMRSDQLAMAKVDVEGIPLYKLSKLQRYYGNDVDLNALIKTDPYCLYIHFDDFSFTKAVSLANRLGVPNQSESAIRGAVIAALRRDAWLGHSVIEGARLGQSVMQLLRIMPDAVRPHLPGAVAELRRLDLIHVEGRTIQLKRLHDAEARTFELARERSALDEADLELDVVPSEEMGLQMLRPMKLKQAESKQLLSGLSGLLSECFGIVQCQTFEDQLFVAKALALIFDAYKAVAYFCTFTKEMATEAQKIVGLPIPVMTYSELLGIDQQTGIPLAQANNPVDAEAVVIIGADALGVEEMGHVLDAVSRDSRLYLLGCPRDLPSLGVGQPFADLMESKMVKAFHSGFWGVTNNAKRECQEALWASALAPAEDFDPTQPISWLDCEPSFLETFLPDAVKQIADSLDVDPIADIRIVAPSVSSPVVKRIIASMTDAFTTGIAPKRFQNHQYHEGIPVVIRQPLISSDCPPFSVYIPTAVMDDTLHLKAVDGSVAQVEADERIDAFDAVVMTPKFIRGRRYEVVVLLALAEQYPLITHELISSLLNTARRSLVVVGEASGAVSDMQSRASGRVRSKLLNWVEAQ